MECKAKELVSALLKDIPLRPGMSLKRPREDIVSDIQRNVKAKKDAEDEHCRLLDEYESHPDTMLEKLPVCLRVSSISSRLTELEISDTTQTYTGIMTVQTWICKFRLDGKMKITFLARKKYLDQDLERRARGDREEWNTFGSLNEQNRRFYEMLGNDGVEDCYLFDFMKCRKLLLGKDLTRPDIVQKTIKMQHGREACAIFLLIHLYHFPTEDPLNLG